MADVGRRIRELREAKNLTQQELADRLRKHPQTVWRWEAGDRVPSVIQLQEIADALGVLPRALFEDPLVSAR